jgi:D-sedoheptulose 7-phosphate isomerase
MRKKIEAILKESIAVKELLYRRAIPSIIKLTELVTACLKKGGKVILFGNGGSAADAQHIAAELVGRFTCQRKALAAMALSCNSSILTCIANDYSFEQIFSRQIDALGADKDVAIGISTSGNSPNILAGIESAKRIGMKTACLTAEAGRKLAQLVDAPVSVPSKNTARIQEAHIAIGHIICELVEKALFGQKPDTSNQ